MQNKARREGKSRRKLSESSEFYLRFVDMDPRYQLLYKSTPFDVVKGVFIQRICSVENVRVVRGKRRQK